MELFLSKNGIPTIHIYTGYFVQLVNYCYQPKTWLVQSTYRINDKDQGSDLKSNFLFFLDALNLRILE